MDLKYGSNDTKGPPREVLHMVRNRFFYLWILVVFFSRFEIFLFITFLPEQNGLKNQAGAAFYHRTTLVQRKPKSTKFTIWGARFSKRKWFREVSKQRFKRWVTSSGTQKRLTDRMKDQQLSTTQNSMPLRTDHHFLMLVVQKLRSQTHSTSYNLCLHFA